MKRPNKKDYLTTNQIEYNQMLNKYYDDLEAYIDILKKQLTLTDVVGQGEQLCACDEPEINDMRWACDNCGKDFDNRYRCA